MFAAQTQSRFSLVFKKGKKFFFFEKLPIFNTLKSLLANEVQLSLFFLRVQQKHFSQQSLLSFVLFLRLRGKNIDDLNVSFAEKKIFLLGLGRGQVFFCFFSIAHKMGPKNPPQLKKFKLSPSISFYFVCLKLFSFTLFLFLLLLQLPTTFNLDIFCFLAV